jgi:hypothetical protein
MVYLFNFENKPLFELNLSQTNVKYTQNDKESNFNLDISQISIQGEDNSQIFWMKNQKRNSLEV